MVNFLPGVRATKDQRRVLSRYLENGGDKVDAYWYVFGPPKADKSAKARQSKAHNYFAGSTMAALLKEANIEARVKLEIQAQNGVQNAIAKYSISKDRIMEELAKIAFAQQTDVMSWGPDGVVVKDSKDIGDASAAIGEVVQTGGGDAPVIMKVKLLDKQQALINLGRELGMFSQKVDLKGAVAVAAKFVIEK